MSTKEMLLQEIDAMNETQLQGLLLFIQGCYADVPNAETLAVMEEIENGRNLSKAFHSVSELMEDLNADD